jgi:hypothetical protein
LGVSGLRSTRGIRSSEAAAPGTALNRLVDGGVIATFIDWRGLPIIQTAAVGVIGAELLSPYLPEEGVAGIQPVAG